MTKQVGSTDVVIALDQDRPVVSVINNGEAMKRYNTVSIVFNGQIHKFRVKLDAGLKFVWQAPAAGLMEVKFRRRKYTKRYRYR